MKNFLPLLIIFFSSGLWAQSPQDDPKIMDAFRATCARLAEHPFTTGNFEQEKTANRRSRPLKSSGDFIVAVGLGMVWDTAKPFPSTLVLGTDYIIQSRPGGQKNIINAQGNDTFISMAQVMDAVFSGNAQGLLDNFEVHYTGGGGSAAWDMELFPRNKTLASFMTQIMVKGDTDIRSLEIYEQNGGMTKYILLSHNYPAELSAHEKSLFSLP